MTCRPDCACQCHQQGCGCHERPGPYIPNRPMNESRESAGSETDHG